MIKVAWLPKRAPHLGLAQFRPWWDGCAGRWFETEADFAAADGRSTPGPSRADTLKRVSRFQRLIVEEHEIAVQAQ